MMPGRRYSEGQHQALEAKEKVQIQPENQTLASITFQNYFRMYSKLAGMTGTASTEAEEFANIYSLDVVEVPTNLPIQRIDESDEVYRTAEEKFKAIIEEIKTAHERGQPVLVGTTSIEKSELLAAMLKQVGFNSFNVLNARYHEQEAYIVSQAGVPGAVTIATNMAGRGTDIQLGGNIDMRLERELEGMEPGPERDAKEQAIRTEVKQLKERPWPLVDDLMRIFGSDRMDGMLQKLGLKDGEAIVHPWINKALERAQKKVEARNFDVRKNLLKYDDVTNDQRKVIFEQRIELMDATDLSETVADMRHEVIECLSPSISRAGLCRTMGCRRPEGRRRTPAEPRSPDCRLGTGRRHCRRRYPRTDHRGCGRCCQDRAERFGPEIMTYVERSILLQTLDHLWREHIVNLDHLRSVVGFRGYAQRDPLQEYKAEASSCSRRFSPTCAKRDGTADARRTDAGAGTGTGTAALHAGPPYRCLYRPGRIPDGRLHAGRSAGKSRSLRPLHLGQGWS
ncbi:hypothetical protein Lal_00002646 [Lupinus albus]|nr:hypothetical protein Lal_00002646 [Lupinus albus]